MRSFSNSEVKNCQIFKDSISFSNELGKVVELWCNFLKSLLNNLFIFFPEVFGNFAPNIIKKSQNGLDSDCVLNVFSE